MTPEEAYQAGKETERANMLFLPISNYGQDAVWEAGAMLIGNALDKFLPGTGFLTRALTFGVRNVIPWGANQFSEGVEEWVQERVKQLALGEEPDNEALSEAFRMGVLDATVYGVVGLLFRQGFNAVGRGVRRISPQGRMEAQIKKVIDNTVRDVVKIADVVNNGRADEIVGQDEIVFLPKSKIDEQTKQALNLQEEVMEDEEGNVVKEQPEGQPVTEVTEETQQATESTLDTETEVTGVTDSVTEVTEESRTEDAEATAEPVEPEEEEVAVPKDVWDKFVAENPEKAQELADDVRRGVRGVTAREELARKIDTLRRSLTENPELDSEVKRVEQEVLQATGDAEQARELSTIAGVVARAMNEQYEMPYSTTMNVMFKSDSLNGQAQAESYSQAYNKKEDLEENISRGNQAMEKVISEHTDVMNAMHRNDVGDISFVWGTPGHGENFKGGRGVSHLIAHRNAQGYDGEAVARKMVDVIANGYISAINGKGTRTRVCLSYEDYTAILSLYDYGERKTWLLTGWENYKKLPGASSEGDGSSRATLNRSMLSRPEEGAGNFFEIVSEKQESRNAENETYYQSNDDSNEEESNRGGIYWSDDSPSFVKFFSTADKSTGFHELWHHTFRVLTDAAQLSDASDLLKHDVGVILKNAGVSWEEFYSNQEARTKAHEYFAKAGEAYLREGVAPTPELANTFERIKQWLVEIYKNIKESLGIELNDEMRDIFDRLLATPEQLAGQESANEIDTLYEATQQEIEELQQKIDSLEAELKDEHQDHDQQEEIDRYARRLNDRATQKLISEVKARERADAKVTLSELKQQYKEILKNTKAEYKAKIADIKDKQAESLRKEKDKRIRKEAKARLRKYYADRRNANRIAKLKERIEKLKQNQKLLMQRQRERQKIRDRVKKIRNALNRMSKSESIIYNRQQEIRNLLSTYDLSRNGKLSLRDYEFIYGQVKDIYDTGKRELAAKNLLTQERVNKAREELAATMPEWEKRVKGAVTGREDLAKQYKGIKGKAQKILDWAAAKTLNAQRFFDYLDDGKGKYDGAWVKTFIDDANTAYNKEMQHKFARMIALEVKMQQLGITPKMLAQKVKVDVPIYNNGVWTVDKLMSIYAGMKNEKSRVAILCGNFAEAETIEQANAWVNECVQALTDEQKALADFIIQEYEDNFDRINEALIDVFNKGMEHEENYTPMKRLEYTVNRNGVLDADAAENLLASQQGSGIRRVDTGFTKSRMNIKAKRQSGIDLGLVSIWHSQMAVQEHAAAFGGLTRDLKRILFGRPENGEATIRRMVKETRGQYAWQMISQYLNILAASDTRNAYDALDDLSQVMARNMSIAYLYGNLGVVLKQFGSFPRAMFMSSPTTLLNNLRKAMASPGKFMDECFELDPQLRFRNGDPIFSELRKGADGQLGELYDNLLKWGSAPIGWMDRFTSCVVFKSVYDSNRKNGLSHDDAVREGQRAVLLTQPAAHVKDKPLVWQQHGYARLAMMFTNDMAQTFGLTLYDMTQAIRRKDVPAALAHVTGLTLAAMIIKALTSGAPDEPDEPEEWAKWIASAFTENEISSIPLIGKNALALWDYHRGFLNDQSAFITPFAKLMAGTRGLWDDKKDNDERALFNVLEGAALLAPFPATALKRLWRTGKELGNGEMWRAVKNMVGIHVQDKKLRKTVGF